jgi:hypothetical protein
MAFPIKDFEKSRNKTTQDEREKSFTPQELLDLREVFFNKLLQEETRDVSDQIALQISRLVQIESRSASTEATIYDNTTGNSSSRSAPSSLTKQVERAFIQVLGGAPGRGSDRFMKSLVSTFPAGKDGRVTFTPIRSVISLSGSTSNSMDNVSRDWSGQLSVEQASLYRQGSLIIADALRLLEGIEPFDPKADLDAVEALRALIRSNLNYLVEEFGRIDKPRFDFVDNYFASLEKNIQAFGQSTILITKGQNDNLVNAEDESQIAAYQLIKNYIEITLKSAWKGYLAKSDVEIASNSYSERLARVNVMLPVVAEGIVSVMDAMDSVGFTESERRSDTALFSKLTSGNISFGIPIFSQSTATEPINNPDNLSQKIIDILGAKSRGFDLRSIISANQLLQEFALDFVVIPRITVNDFSEWVERFASLEAPSILGTSGRFGLEFVTDQADTLFWIIGIVLDYIKFHPEVRQKNIGRVLTFDRVQQTLIELFSHLKTLADLGITDPRFAEKT